jgi:hypothetical protein
MFVPLEYLNCVVFIGEGADDRLIATGYFVSVPWEGVPGGRHVYLVTAGHAVEDRSDLFVRMNNGTDPSAGLRTVRLPDHRSEPPQWLFVERLPEGTDHVDLAVLRWENDGVGASGYRSIPAEMFFDESMWRTEDDPGAAGSTVGDEVFALGLSTVHYGADRNEPTVRVGNLALVPQEPVVVGPDSKGWPDRQRLYLAELRSITGLSGSPVFIQTRDGAGAFRVVLLGTMRGHWEKGEGVHLGIGQVIPAPHLHEILYSHAARSRRQWEETKHAVATGLMRPHPGDPPT